VTLAAEFDYRDAMSRKAGALRTVAEMGEEADGAHVPLSGCVEGFQL
jgi:hypothetical protein